VHRLGPARVDVSLDPSPDLHGDLGPKLDLSERCAQIEARAADNDRPPPLGEQRIDLAAGELGEAPGAELVIDLGDPEQTVLERGALLRGRRARQRLEAAVDLQRVAAQRHGVLAALAQPLGDRDRHPGLAGRGRAEDREDPQGTRESSRSAPDNVVDVAPVISTSTSSPPAAVPSKLTVLL
jgi:hypothetical protein